MQCLDSSFSLSRAGAALSNWGRIAVIKFKPWGRSAFFACMTAAMLVTACDIPERPPLRPTVVDRQQAVDAVEALNRAEQEKIEPPGTPFAGNWETWDAYFIADRHVGFAHVVARSDDQQPEDRVEYTLESEFYKNLGKLRLRQYLTQTTTETVAGNLVDFQSVLRVGPVVTSFRGSVQEGLLSVASERGSARTTRAIPWESKYRGLVALEQSLRRRPMVTQNEERTLMLLLPGQYELATAKMRCSGEANVPLMDGTIKKLIEINCQIIVGDNDPAYSTIWTNREGGIVRSFSPAMQLVTYRTDKATAKNFDLYGGPAAFVSLEGTLKQPKQARRVAYRIISTVPIEDSESTLSIRPAPGQYVRQTDTTTLEVLVSRRPENVAKGFLDGDFEPQASHLGSSFFIDSNAAAVRQIASVAVGSRELSKREEAIELAQTVKRIVDDKPLDDGLTKASDVARYMVGDELDRAVLLAALLRTREISACLAVGMKYAETGNGEAESVPSMVNHVWVLAHLDEKWLHIDATDARIAGADRLILATTDLSGSDEYDAWLPLFNTLPRLTIKVIGQN